MKNKRDKPLKNEKQSDLEKHVCALEQSAGAWSLEHHLELKDDKRIDQWPRKRRKN